MLSLLTHDMTSMYLVMWNTTLPSFSMEWHESFGEMERSNVPPHVLLLFLLWCINILCFRPPMLIRWSLVCVVITYKRHDIINVFGHVKYETLASISMEWQPIYLVKWKPWTINLVPMFWLRGALLLTFCVLLGPHCCWWDFLPPTLLIVVVVVTHDMT
jgi:hypothetical protein